VADGKDPRQGQDVLDAAEIGYTWLAERAQRTPVNTEAKFLLLRHAFQTWRCYRVTLKTDERNTARGARSNAWGRISTACCARSSRPPTAAAQHRVLHDPGERMAEVERRLQSKLQQR